MTLIHPGCDTRHIIRQAMNSKGLATLAEEEDTFQARKGEPIRHEPMSPSEKRQKLICTKDDLEEFKASCKDKSPDEIFEKLGINVEYNEDGSKKISHYKWPFQAFSFKSAGIDEEKLLEGVTEIKGKCNLSGSSLKNLGEVKAIGRDLVVPYFSKVEDLSSIQRVGGNIICEIEDPKDAIAKLKDIKLNPKSIGGCVNPHDMFRMYGFSYISYIPKDMQQALNALQGRK